jgi:hypothetical protein
MSYRKKEEIENELWEDKRQMERLGCQITHIKWGCLGKNRQITLLLKIVFPSIKYSYLKSV